MIERLRRFFGGGAGTEKHQQPRLGALTPPTGKYPTGQPSPVWRTQCLACDFVGPFSPRLPCPACEAYPYGTNGLTQHRRVLCVWRWKSEWSKPWTWLQGGEYVPLPEQPS